MLLNSDRNKSFHNSSKSYDIYTESFRTPFLYSKVSSGRLLLMSRNVKSWNNTCVLYV